METLQTSPETINCNGAFVINSYEPSAVTITAEKNADYYDADKVSLEGVEWQVMLEAQTAAMSYESGDSDVTTLTGDLIEHQDDPAFTTVHDSYLWYVSPNMEVTGSIMKISVLHLQNLSIRQLSVTLF